MLEAVLASRPAQRVEFRILGPIEVRDGDRALPLGGKRQRALLALLLMRANEVVSRDLLIDELWAGDPPKAAVNVLQSYVSHLRKVLPADVLTTREPGYALEIDLDDLDLHRLERLVEDARTSLGHGDADAASSRLRQALDLWRGEPLADFTHEPFAQAEIARLEEVRLAAVELRVEADLAHGRHAEIVGELEALVAKHPLREHLRALLMLALYRGGRQVEALASYRDARRILVEDLGIEPGDELQALERRILVHDPDLLEPGAAAVRQGPPEHAGAAEIPLIRGPLLIVSDEGSELAELLALGEPLARDPARELILARIVPSDAELAEAVRELHETRASLLARGVDVRAAAFTSPEPGNEVVRLAKEQEAQLVLLSAAADLLGDGVALGDLRAVLLGAPCDVAVAAAGKTQLAPEDGRTVLVPFGGAEHEWAALELAAWLAGAAGAGLRLLGTEADPEGGKRDASRLLATASLLVQRVTGVAAEPLLVPPGEDAVVEAADDAGLVVVGFPDDWRSRGIGRVRLSVARRTRATTVLVRGGLRPGGLSPKESVTRFSWTLVRGASEQ